MMEIFLWQPYTNGNQNSAKTPESALVFEKLYNYLSETDLKRKKIELKKPQDEITNLRGYHIILQLPELSILSPLRKKLNLIIAAKDDSKIIALTKSIDDPNVEPDFILNDLSSDNILLATVLPIPEKKNTKYLILSYKQNYNQVFKNEPLLLQLNFDILNQQWLPILQQLNYTSLISYLQKQFQICGFNLTNPFEESTESFYVEAHRGSKEGVLYFLPGHIIFGFKKPILIYNSNEIDSITYTSITRITFNVTLLLNNGEKTEFSMIDQQDYDKINEYVQTKEYRDQSMANEHKLQTKMKNNESEGILGQVLEENNILQSGGEEDSDDDEEDANYQFGAEESEDDASASSRSSNSSDDDFSGDEDDESDEGEEEEDIEVWK